jgi:hypothetical protein
MIAEHQGEEGSFSLMKVHAGGKSMLYGEK